MSETDVAVGVTNTTQTYGLLKKPCYLIIFVPNVKDIDPAHFFCIDKPEQLVGGVQAKGFFVKGDISNIKENYSNIVGNQEKETFQENMFPYYRIDFITNLVFKAK